MALERVVWLVAAACYAPSARTGAPCGEGLLCPSGQVCLADRCEREGTTLADADTALDGVLPIDAVTMGWAAPSPLGLALGQTKSDPSFTLDRLTIAFVRNDDLFLATRAALGSAFTIATFPFNMVNISDKSPELTADGSTLYFASNRDGDYDIFMSTRLGPTWSAPMKVGVWATGQNEYDVAISPDELTAFVTIGGDLRRSTRNTKLAAWSAPVTVDVAWGANPTAPAINAAGDVYYHASNPRDLFVARRQGNGYGAPLPLAELNTATGREAAPAISADDRYLVFERDAELVETSR